MYIRERLGHHSSMLIPQLHMICSLLMLQEKELAMAAEKLAECQKTIASLGRQLKSLTTLDDFMLESEKSELNGGSPNPRGDGRIPNLSDSSGDITISTLSNGKGRGSPQSLPSSTSMQSGIGSLLSRSRSCSRIENQ